MAEIKKKPRGPRESLKAVNAALQDMWGGASRLSVPEHTSMPHRKASLRQWRGFTTVSWRADMAKDYHEHQKKTTRWGKIWGELVSWLIPALVGFLTATSGWFIEKIVEWLGDLRFGYCPNHYVWVTKESCGPTWVMWSQGFTYYVLVSTALATVSATLTYKFAPLARGSGIPEIKTILGGFSMPGVLEMNTLVIKITGLSMSVAAGLSCGKEGPLVHIACCFSNLISKCIPRYARNEAKQRELLSCACAAGVAVAFGAPLGGVLFSLEEASTLFPNRTMIRAFFASSVAAVSLAWWNPTGSGKLTMFEAHYDQPPHFIEYSIFLLLGVVGGCIGALFVHYNILVSKARAPGTRFRKHCPIIVEVMVIALVTALTSYHLLYTRVLSNSAIRALFFPCKEAAAEHVDPHSFMLDLCVGEQPLMTKDLMISLAVSAFLRFVQMIFTFGTGCPAGLFIPSLYTGAALGRIVGILTAYFFWKCGLNITVYPGIYAMIGAASVLGGVCRVTISLVVIMFELTGGLQLIVPFMLACLTAKFVGDFFTMGIYDYCIVIRKYPFLHEPDDATFNIVASDVMDADLVCLHTAPMAASSLLRMLSESRHGGYPLTQSADDHTFLGYIQARPTRIFLEEALATSQTMTPESKVGFIRFAQGKHRDVIDISHLVDECVLQAVSKTPAAQMHSMFRNLGVKVIVICDKGQLKGMVTKKSFINAMEELTFHGYADEGTTLQENEAALLQSSLNRVTMI